MQLAFAPFFLSQQVPPLLNNLLICRLLNCITTCIGILLRHTEHLLVIPRAEHFGICTRRIPYMANHLTDPCKYLHFSGVTDMFGLSFSYKFENPVLPPSDYGKICRFLKMYSFMRRWKNSSKNKKSGV